MFDDWVAAINRQLPEASDQAKHSFVEVAPFLAILSAALGLLLGGRGSLLLSLPALVLAGYLPSVFLILIALSPVLALASFPGLRARTRLGWGLFAASVVIDLALSLLRLDVFGILFGALFTYLLLQTYFEYGRRWYR